MTRTPSTVEQRCGYVALLGWTNVGKSTLLNRLVGTKLAAVADVAQTTRHRIVGALTEPRGQLLFVDTPGLHRPRHRMNRAMVELAEQAASQADVTVLIVDAARGLGPGDRQAAQVVRRASAKHLAVLNKIDLLRDKRQLLPLMAELAEELGFADVVPVAALTGEGCDDLLETLFRLMPLGPLLYEEDYLTDQPERVLAAEWIREKLLAATRQELPHATAVVVERWLPRAGGALAIEATVLVERESQKPIVIGRDGAVLKRVGSAARVELEALLDRPVHLRLWVKVRRDWRDDPATLRELGFD